MSAAVVTEALTKHFGAVVGVESIGVEIQEGEVFGFLGGNGAGKTTTFRLLLDLLHPTSGRASILGLDCQRQGLEARRRVGYLPGEVPFHPDLTGESFLTFLSRLGGRPVSGARLERLLRRFDVSALDQRRKLRELSHGMKRKLGIVQALMTGPPVLLLDEPTSGLDPLRTEAFCETIDELKREGGTTILLSSHALSEVERLCDRIGLLRHGQLIGTPRLEELRARAPRVVIVEFHEPADRPADLANARFLAREDRRWVVELSGSMGPLVAALAGQPVADLRVEESSLVAYVRKESEDLAPESRPGPSPKCLA